RDSGERQRGQRRQRGGLGAQHARAQAAGWQPVGLGPRVLRAETAPLAVLAALALP
ncbi:16S rRNA (uracil(1498)-N(3))-methyltransferase, partial [Ottowia sp.]|uniref:16S rRNA (uracil(1498)-N(3))-methyltransferase n=1 Tax=Ottowia sp. TaxID=1898956 RepID=UPI0039E356C0